MMASSSQTPVLHRNSCAECQRRKQKCNREWPCNHCQKRRVVDKCRFGGSAPSVEKPASSGGQKRAQPYEDDDAQNGYDSDSDGPGLEALGYMDGPLLASLGLKVDKPKKCVQDMDWATPEESFPMRQALAALPPRPKMDSLVQLFFDNVNYHYYIMYPATFLQEYQDWWDRRIRNQSLSIQWTSLLLTICACATQHLDVDEKPLLESDFGEQADVLTERYLNAGKELANSIPDGHYHLLNVQRMLHAIYWYKSEARFIEAWHLIGTAVREAQELGLQKDSASRGLPEFDREMRRRVWCVLSTWDWQFASGLGRPTIVDHRDVDVAQPTLTLEGHDPSPLLHMKLQAQAVAILASKFGAPRNVETPQQIQEYLRILEDWMRTFPTVYSTENADHSRDATHPWAVSHRFYIHTMAYLMVLNPIRAYMARKYSRLSNKEELRIREIGVHYALKNLETTSEWTSHVHHKDGRFHFIIFSLFDTATVLSATIIKDEDYSVPQRAKVIKAIDKAVDLLGTINRLSKTASTSYGLLSGIVKRVPGSSHYGRRKRAKFGTPASVTNRSASYASPDKSRNYTSPSMGGGETEEAAVRPGSETASPSNYYTNDSGTRVTTPKSQTVATPETEPPHMVPVVHEQPISAFSADNQLSYAGYDQSSLGMDTMLQPSFPPLGEMPPADDMRYDGLVTMGPYTELQPVAPAAGEMFDAPPITDTELGDFSRLWDWGSLGFDFISSEAASLPMPPGMGQEQGQEQGQGQGQGQGHGQG